MSTCRRMRCNLSCLKQYSNTSHHHFVPAVSISSTTFYPNHARLCLTSLQAHTPSFISLIRLSSHRLAGLLLRLLLERMRRITGQACRLVSAFLALALLLVHLAGPGGCVLGLSPGLAFWLRRLTAGVGCGHFGAWVELGVGFAWRFGGVGWCGGAGWGGFGVSLFTDGWVWNGDKGSWFARCT